MISIAVIIGCQSSGDKPKKATSKSTEKKVAKVDGEKIYKMNCVVCHGADGTLGINNAGNIPESKLTKEERIQLVTNGKNTMTAFGTLLKEEQIKAVVDYTLTLKK